MSAASNAAGLRVAVVGSGPAGFYATDFLLKAKASVDLFERLPAPFGLLRYGVAPDHQNIKRVGVAFERTATLANFRYFGNVELGRDVAIEELLADYDQVLIAIGAAGDKKLGVPGEELAGSVAATSFVGWYNGHPDFAGGQYDLGAERVVIVGIGNVALDVARILARSPSELAGTDIASYALDALRASRVRDIVLLGRRGPAQAAFDQGEIADIADLSGVEVVVEGDVSFADSADLPVSARRNVEYLAGLPRQPTGKAERVVRVRFLAAPKAIRGGDGRVEAIDIERTELVTKSDGSVSARATGELETLPAQMVVRSIGYAANALPGVPFDTARSVIPNQAGRVGLAGEPIGRCYTVGWIKRGPVGLIGTNKQDARETVDSMLEDAETALAQRAERRPGRVLELLTERGVRVVRHADWLKIDNAERSAGSARGKVREKFYGVAEMLAAIDAE